MKLWLHRMFGALAVLMAVLTVGVATPPAAIAEDQLAFTGTTLSGGREPEGHLRRGRRAR